MKKTFISCGLALLAICFPLGLMAQGHRIGVSLGSASGAYQVGSEETAMSGELLELPLYTYAADNGLAVGLRLMEFAVRGEESSSTSRLKLSYRQSLLAAGIGYEFRLGDAFFISPQYVKSYLGSGRFTYSRYSRYTTHVDTLYEYVSDSGSLSVSADLAGVEIPFYWVTEHFFFGIKFCTFTNRTAVSWNGGDDGAISITSALQFLLEAKL